MASTFFGLTVAGSGLATYNAAINTTANNVANVRTDGYTRQVVEQRAAEALRANTKYGMIGSGTEATEIKQIRDLFDHTVDHGLSFPFLGFNQRSNLMVMNRVKIVEAEVFQFILDTSEAQTVSDRTVDL